MKPSIVSIRLLAFAAFCLISVLGHAGFTPGKEDGLISIKLYNNSLLPRKIKLISYQPNEQGNNTQTFFLLPYSSKSLSFPVGTRLYLASQEQINTVMSGKPIQAAPWHTVSRADAKTPINLNRP
jgi:hypothetical protein